jgi:hypothetical protein
MMLRGPSASNVVKGRVEVVAVVIGEAAVDLRQTMAELISVPSLELFLLESVNDTKRRDFVASVTRRDIVSSSA